jgi:hypothetical protein
MFETELKGEGGSVLLPAGWNTHIVTGIEQATSKTSGNPMFILTIEEPNSGSVDTVYMTDVKGKRWLLKQFLAACGVEEDAESKVKWCEEDVVGCSIEAKNVPEPNEYVTKAGETIKEMRNKINGFRKTEVKATV